MARAGDDCDRRKARLRDGHACCGGPGGARTRWERRLGGRALLGREVRAARPVDVDGRSPQPALVATHAAGTDRRGDGAPLNICNCYYYSPRTPATGGTPRPPSAL